MSKPFSHQNGCIDHSQKCGATVSRSSKRNELRADKYFETSAKEGDSVEEVFKLLTLEILKTSGKI